jgi:hypothetical protein
VNPTDAWLAAAREKIRRVLATPPPEGPSEHLRNAETLLLNVAEEHPIIRHTCPETTRPFAASARHGTS